MNKKKTALLALVVCLMALAFILLNRFLIPKTLEPGNYKTALVDFGPVAMSVPATGVINPENEVLLLSPASTILSKIHVAPGSRVAKGDMLLSLDSKAIQQEIETLQDQLNIMENDLQKNRLNARSIRVDLDYNAEVKKLRISSLKTEIIDQEQLLKVGGISPAMLEQTKQELVLAEKDLKVTQEKNSIRLKQLEADEQGLQLQIDMRYKELEVKKELLGRMSIKAPSNGIILSIHGNAGEKVDRDKVLVKMSDLSTYKIKCSIDNKFVETLKTGGEVYAIVDHSKLRGKIGSVSPVISDKRINFDVFLDYSHYNKLIPNLEVDLMIVTQQKDSVLRIERGPAFNRGKQHEAFVVNGDKARRVPIETGLLGTDYVEIISGLQAGDRVIVSDISSYRHRKEIDLQEF